MFGCQTELNQSDVDNIAKKFHIPSHYMYRALKSSEYISDQKDREIAISVAHLEAELRFPLHPFFIQFIKNFWIQLKQLLLNGWRYLVAYVQLCHKNKVYVRANALITVTKMSQHMKNFRFVYLPYKKKDMVPKVYDTNKDCKRKWFFIKPEDLELDQAFSTVWHKIILIGS